jgi:membrane protein DedA with SNARE-associated domain
VSHFLETWGYLAIFILTVLESACVPIPSEVTLGLGGALASGAVVAGTHGGLNLGLVIMVGTLGSVVGSLIAYAVGRTGGRTLVNRFGRYVMVSDSDVDRVERWFRGRGEWAVLYGRVIPVVRTFVSLPAGLARMSVARFAALTAVGVALWVTLLSSIGYALGTSWESITRAFGAATYVVLAVGAVAVVAFLVHRLRAVRQRGEGALVDAERETV